MTTKFKLNDELIERAAKLTHEVNKAYCEFLGDNSQPKWEDAPEWQKESAKDGITTSLLNEYYNGADMHQNWMDEKIRTGWKYGPVKDPTKKEHPCMVPYYELPIEQQAKDSLFLEVCHVVLRLLRGDKKQPQQDTLKEKLAHL